MVVMGRTVVGKGCGPWIELGWVSIFSESDSFSKGFRGEMERHAKGREIWMGLDVLALS
ncbi:hypothetical protein BDW42DRAFT_160776 [Aspergillus taichungensis]|uniref:Uncharacterized protein n=1 Tax=Aspergillus taichungensis TaxID=482145 RepID=A0A2J5I5P1_9EURO|nr:hypothetical protein BDW42DRAFT_160776 [Aspergillus taichungensis]